METMSSSIEPVVPRTANLLACKQWWRVCFLYGDQQKYYRQVYGKAAAQRLALSNPTTKSDIKNDNCTTTTTTTSITSVTNNNTEISLSEDRDYDIITDFIETQLGELQEVQQQTNNNKNKHNNNNNNNNEKSHVTNEQKKEQTVALFPAKYLSTSTNTASMTMRKSKKLLSSLRTKHENGNSNLNKSNKHKEKQKFQHITNDTKTNARITVMDDPFLFGIDEDHLGDLIRPKQYAISATEDISKYFNYYVDQQPQQQQYIDDQPDSEPKPALPPKKKPRPITAIQPSALCLNDSDLQFLNMNLRNPTINTANDDTHDISFTFNEENNNNNNEMPENVKSQLSLKDENLENDE